MNLQTTYRLDCRSIDRFDIGENIFLEDDSESLAVGTVVEKDFLTNCIVIETIPHNGIVDYSHIVSTIFVDALPR